MKSVILQMLGAGCMGVIAYASLYGPNTTSQQRFDTERNELKAAETKLKATETQLSNDRKAAETKLINERNEHKAAETKLINENRYLLLSATDDIFNSWSQQDQAWYNKLCTEYSVRTLPRSQATEDSVDPPKRCARRPCEAGANDEPASA
jgi:hypothetical protein